MSSRDDSFPVREQHAPFKRGENSADAVEFANVSVMGGTGGAGGSGGIFGGDGGIGTGPIKNMNVYFQR
ncbi:hypothetical protein MSAN_01829400 [Mycena sanguinolenta]|uniref:Uncharacterized protein n=1 Tax=Mycena sanguinolenta TaxID=230812 RepID=A0A8H6XSP4_9AGAR|nr:hypothetical protein MSAN_01829400 [Mycena sanguinolenta]